MAHDLFDSPDIHSQDTHLHWGNLNSSAQYLALANAATQHKRPILLLTDDLQQAYQAESALKFFAASLPIFLFPDWETLPYDHFSPHADIVSQRLLTLHKLLSLQEGIIICAMSTCLHRLAPLNFLQQNIFALHCQDHLKLNDFQSQLSANGYRHVGQVMEHGEFSVRGSIVDVFPMGSSKPLRIELFDDEIESLRYFNPDTQTSIEKIHSIEILPAHEYPLDEAGITLFRQNWREHFSGNPLDAPLYQQISHKESGAGAEYYLSLFFEKTATLFDYLPKSTLIFSSENLKEKLEQLTQEFKQRYEQLRYDITRPVLPPKAIFLSSDELFSHLKSHTRITLHEESIEEKPGHTNFNLKALPSLRIERKLKRPLSKLEDFLLSNPKLLICAESAGRRETLLELLGSIALKPKIAADWQDFLAQENSEQITIAPIQQGFMSDKLALVTEADLFGEHVVQQRQKRQQQIDPDLLIRDLAELKLQDPVVHLDHGVGRYLGLKTITTGETQGEYLTLEYANKDKIYVPVSSLHLISRYTASNPEHAPLTRLGTSQWQKSKEKALKKVRDVAAELLDLYSKRQATPGYAFPKADEDYQAFRQAFPFEETQDQRLAIDAVLHDMTTARAMDRLVCGDVGFGKTEVAMQAAFLAANASKQVAILVPTTLLTNQHYQNFQDRFANWPIKIGVLCRLQTKKQQDTTLAQLANGTIDIVIGTHKLLQQDIKIKQLGLLIVDEEHRFGVRQKEKIKALRANVDILTLTATPIPRTLNMAMSGTRDLSIIATPPARRLAVKTFVCEYQASIIQEAISREIMRGGQVYFLHNDVATIQATAEKLQSIVPEARIAIAHGQMRERDLERVMSDFYHQKFNVLLCTTIIESGIDVPTANTIMINKANHFGLAQLHQLRGRVGRSHHQAYAYLLAPNKKALSRDAKKRLEAFSQLQDLGVGFSLATHDLEIRGAGELLGEEQSGHMHEVGFSLYMEMLNQAVTALKAGEELDFDWKQSDNPEMDLQISALIPENYVPDVNTRLRLYKHLSMCKSEDEINQFKAEMIDRFGLLPEPTQHLFSQASLCLLAKSLGVKSIKLTKEYGYIDFNEKPNINPAKIIELIQRASQQYQLQGASKLRFVHRKNKAAESLKQLNELLNLLSES